MSLKRREFSKQQTYKKVLEELVRHDQKGTFHRPVVEEWPIVTMVYTSTVRHPMDLRTMMERVDAGQFDTPQDFSDALDLCWLNCFLFNHNCPQYMPQALEMQRRAAAICKRAKLPEPKGRTFQDLLNPGTEKYSFHTQQGTMLPTGATPLPSQAARRTPPPAAAPREREKRKRPASTAPPPPKKKKRRLIPQPPMLVPQEALPPTVDALLAADKARRRATTATCDLAQQALTLIDLLETEKAAAAKAHSEADRAARAASLRWYAAELREVEERCVRT
eukprot:TRINITY_DN5042_c0_g3_i5.p1 TRINITY_DN5042_c0_g3~~TRINITY_DN5042_c0_g3_i5.p1  ORF type:complete len:278 (+),score=96.00 TRINITY_DN5042_c0_g3_i5:102-935(+)